MCLGVPMRILRLQDSTGVVESGGLELEVSLALVEDPRVGEFVLVHAGYAIQKIDEDEARDTLQLLRELLHLRQVSG
ncbi:MAG: HypC/HybG/HupF family hydrogenase formation chaperone [Pseudomonadota bacterium]